MILDSGADPPCCQWLAVILFGELQHLVVGQRLVLIGLCLWRLYVLIGPKVLQSSELLYVNIDLGQIIVSLMCVIIMFPCLTACPSMCIGTSCDECCAVVQPVQLAAQLHQDAQH